MFIQKITRFLRGVWWCFFSWEVALADYEELLECQVALGQSFGLREDGPGLSNESLAKIIEWLQEAYPHLFPPLVQWEIRDALPKGYVLSFVVEKHRVEGKYLETREVFAQQAEVCHQNGWQRVIALAHPDHMGRVCEVIRAFKLDPVPFPITPSAANTVDVPYDPLSSQWWTRSRPLFKLREIPTRIYYLLRGWIDPTNTR